VPQHREVFTTEQKFCPKILPKTLATTTELQKVKKRLFHLLLLDMQGHTANCLMSHGYFSLVIQHYVHFGITNTCSWNNSQLRNYFVIIENELKEFSTFVSNGSLDSVLTTCSSTLSLFVNFFSVYKNIKMNSFLKKGYPGPRDFSFFFSNQNEPQSSNFKLLVIAALQLNLD